jgi:hypothetical protein
VISTGAVAEEVSINKWSALVDKEKQNDYKIGYAGVRALANYRIIKLILCYSRKEQSTGKCRKVA